LEFSRQIRAATHLSCKRYRTDEHCASRRIRIDWRSHRFHRILRTVDRQWFARALLNRKNITEIEYSSVFYFNIALSLVLYAILFLASPFFADIFHEPRIEPVSKVLFLSFVFTAPGLIQHTLLMKKADFKGLTKVNIAALIIAASIAIIMAIKQDTAYGRS